MNDKEIKQEQSIPTAARVNLITLAKLSEWWNSSGHQVRSMSQLISWSMDLLKEILVSNGKILDTEISVVEANRYLSEHGLYQQSVRRRAVKKIATAIRFEGMREEGIDPKAELPSHYNILHNKKSIEAFSQIVDIPQGELEEQIRRSWEENLAKKKSE